MMDFSGGLHMKKISVISLVATLSILPFSCSKIQTAEAPLDPVLLKLSFTACNDTSPLSKTALGPGYSVLWSASDKIALFPESGAAGSSFNVASIEDGGRTATFTGLTPATSNGYYYALNPFQGDAILVSTSGTVNATLPTVQTGVEDSFDPQAALSLARVNAEAEDASDILRFKNVGALLAFKVPGNYVTAVKIASRDGSVAMTGPANIRYNEGNPSVSATTSSKNYVQVTFPSGSIGKTFYAMVYPGNYSEGFDVTFYNSGNAFNRYTTSKALNLGRNQNIRFIEKNWGVSDDRASNTVSGTELIAPVIASCTQMSSTSAKISFSCSSGKRDTYRFYLRDAASMGNGTMVGSLDTGTGQYGSYNYTFTGLSTGASYDFGVSAYSTDAAYGESPVTWYEDFTINAASSGMTVTIDSSAENYYDFVVNYTISGITSTGVEHGLIFSYANATPTCGSVGENGKLPGPAIPSTGTVSFTQCVPNSILQAGNRCYVRAYCYDVDAGNYVYSPVSRLTLGSQPSAYSISRTVRTSPGSGVSLYSFTAGGSYNGYYAVADCSASGSVRLGVNNANMGTTSAISMSSQQSSSGALVLINGQIFGAQGNIGLAYVNGALRYNNSSDDGISACRGYSNSYTTTWQPVTRAILGVSSDGTPGAYWCSLVEGVPYFFDRPIPSGTAGSLVYAQVSASSGPGPKRSWSPAWALSTGPMLLYNGNVCVSEDRITTGVYYTNYELWETSAGNIYGSSRHRSAIGYDESGKVYLVVVNSNVTMTQMARIMKGLGCTYAMNLDGGGSTQMYVKGQGEMTGNNRNVKSTVGFFAR